jgi:predicted ester cyclase
MKVTGQQSADALAGGDAQKANVACLTRYYDQVWNRGDVSVLGEVVAADVSGHDPLAGEFGFEELRGFVLLFREAFPDFETHAEVTVAEGDSIAARFRSGGTFQKAFMGLPPTGLRMRNVGLVMYRFRAGQIVDIWTEWNHHRFLQELGGAVPTLPTPGERARGDG